MLTKIKQKKKRKKGNLSCFLRVRSLRQRKPKQSDEVN